MQVDVAVVETGLGGVRDATNMFSPDTLKLAVITAIGLEHQKALGGSLAEIAAAKAGMQPSSRHFPQPCLSCLGMHVSQRLAVSVNKCMTCPWNACAGIMKPGRPVVIARQPEQEAIYALQKAAQTLHCPVIEPAASVQLQPQARPPCVFAPVVNCQ